MVVVVMVIVVVVVVRGWWTGYGVGSGCGGSKVFVVVVEW